MKLWPGSSSCPFQMNESSTISQTFAQLSPLSVTTFFPPHPLSRLLFLRWLATALSLRNFHKQLDFSGLCFLETSCPPCTQPSWTVRSLRAGLYPPPVPLASTRGTCSFLFSLPDLLPAESRLTEDRSIWFMAQQEQSIMAEGQSLPWLRVAAGSYLCQSGSRERKRKGPALSSLPPFSLFIQSQTTAHRMLHPYSERLFPFHWSSLGTTLQTYLKECLTKDLVSDPSKVDNGN